MNLRKLSLLVASAMLATAAHAQVGIYALASAERMNNIAYTTGNSSSTNAIINPVGGTFGIYYDFRNLGPLRLGVDARGVITHASRGAYTEANGFGAHLDSVLGGVRFGFRTPLPILRPYVEGAAGLGRSNFGTQFTQVNGVEYHGFAGLDIHAGSLLDVRAFELGYGGMSASNPGSRNYPIKSISIGLVLHLPN